jgi:CBS domain-containing protein
MDQNDQSTEGCRRFEHIAARLGRGERVEPVTVRELTGWFGAKRRGFEVNQKIRRALLGNNLRLDPDLNAPPDDGTIEFHDDSENYEQFVLGIFTEELLRTRLGVWLDANPHVGRTQVQTKRAALKDALRKNPELSPEERNGLLFIFNDFPTIIFDWSRNDRPPIGYKMIEWVADSLAKGVKTPRIAVREFLWWFGADRRDIRLGLVIREALLRRNLRTEPDYSEEPIDGEIEFREGTIITELAAAELNQIHANMVADRLMDWKAENPHAGPAEIHAKARELWNLGVGGSAQNKSADIIPFPGRQAPPPQGSLSLPSDATLRVRSLLAGRKPLVSVSPNTTVGEALTKMLLNGFSRLPVISGERNVRGIVNRASIGGHTNDDAEVRQFLEPEKPRTSMPTPH